MKSLKDFKCGWIILNMDKKKGKNSHFFGQITIKASPPISVFEQKISYYYLFYFHNVSRSIKNGVWSYFHSMNVPSKTNTTIRCCAVKCTIRLCIAQCNLRSLQGGICWFYTVKCKALSVMSTFYFINFTVSPVVCSSLLLTVYSVHYRIDIRHCAV